MKTILIFSIAYSPFWGGAEIAIKEITDRLDDYEFDLITLRFDSALPAFERIGNVNVYRIGFSKKNPGMDELVKFPLKLNKIFFPFLALIKALRLNRSRKHEAVWAMMAAYAGFAALFFKFLKPRIPFLLTLQEGDPLEEIRKKVGLAGPLFKRIFRKADKIQAISNHLAGWAREMGYRGEIEVVPNGVDLKNFQTSSPEGADGLKAGLKMADGDKIVITTSRLVKKNGIEDVIRSLSYLPSEIKFLILGTGPDEQRLKAEVASLGLEGRVIFGGYVEHDRLPIFLRMADVFVRPSLSEGLGNSFLEAMAIGLPVIATKVGGIPDFLTDGETGLFCRVADPEDVAGKIRRYLDDEELREKIVAGARRMIGERYDWNRISEEMGRIFGSLCAPKVLVATGLYPPDIGGPATFSKLIHDELPKRGVKIEILSFGAVRRLPKLIRHLVFLFKILKEGGAADSILALDPVSVGLPAFLAAKILKKRFLLRIAGDYAWEQGRQRFGVREFLEDFQTKRYGWRVEALRMIQRAVARGAEKILVPSSYLKEIVKVWGVGAEKIQIVYNAADLPAALMTKEEARARLNLKGTAIFSAGRLVPWKGFESLIEVMSDLEGDDSCLNIAGDGPDFEKLKTKISSLGLEGRVNLLGRLDKDNLSAYMLASDLFILNTGYEGLSHTLLEAMALGTPVITTGAGGNMELVEGDKTGILVPFGNKGRLKEEILRLSRDKLFAQKLAERAREEIAAKFDKEKTMKGLHHFFLEKS